VVVMHYMDGQARKSLPSATHGTGCNHAMHRAVLAVSTASNVRASKPSTSALPIHKHTLLRYAHSGVLT